MSQVRRTYPLTSLSLSLLTCKMGILTVPYLLLGWCGSKICDSKITWNRGCQMLYTKITMELHANPLQSYLTPWTIAHQALLFMGFSRQEFWKRLPFLSPRDLPDPGIEPASLMSLTLAGRLFTTSTTWEACCC